MLTVTDEAGGVVRRITGPVTAGFHRVAWDLRYPAANPTSLAKPAELSPWDRAPSGPLAAPGTYQVSLARRVEGKVTPLAGPVKFSVDVLGTSALPPADRERARSPSSGRSRGCSARCWARCESAREAQRRLDHLKKALLDTPAADPRLSDEARAIESRLKDLQVALGGDDLLAAKNEPVPPAVQDRVSQVVGGAWYSTSAPTKTHQQCYDIAAAQFAPVLEKLRALIEVDLKRLEEQAETAGAPWTPGRVPTWKPE